jgi:prominin 1
VILLILVFVGAVIGFVAQSGVRTNLDSFPSTVTTAATGYRDYLDSVSEEISTVFVDNINTTVSCIQNRSNDVEDMLRLAIDDSSGILTHVSNLTGNGDSIGAQFTSAISNLDDISNTLASLTSLASNIRMNLSELMTMASGSGGPQVPTGMELQDSVATLNMTANPDTLIQEIMMANSTIQDSIRNPSSQFTSGFDKRIMEVVMNIDSVVNSIRSDTEEAANVSSTFTSSITFVRGIVSELVNVTSSLLMGTPIPSQPLLTYDTFEDVWYWVGVFFLILVLVAIVLTTIGLIVGGIPYTCPRALKRKTVSNCGSRLMLISIGSILIYNFLILLASAVGFFLGANLQELCEPLRDDAAFARTVDNFDWRRSNLRVILSSLTSNNNDFENLLLATVDAQLLFAESLRSCERNEPIWTAFKLDDLLSSGNLQPSGQFQRIDIDSTLNTVRDLISATRGSINMTLETVLEDLANNITGQPDVMVNSPLDTTTIAMYVRSSLSAVEVARGNSSALLTQLNTLEQNYTQQNENALAARTRGIIADVQMLENQLTALTNQLTMLNNSNNEYTSQLSSANMSAAQYNQAKGTLPSALINNGSAVYMAVLNVVDSVISPVAQFPDYILRSLNTEIGRCFPVWAGYTNMRNNVCLDLVNYINAFWFSLGWCAFWFSLMIIPLIIMGILFQRPIQYSMSFKDSNHIEMMKKRSSWSWERANSLGEALVQYPPTQIVVVQNPGDITPLIGGEMRTSVLLSESGSVGRPPKSEEPFEKTRRIQDRALPEIPLTDTYVEISPNKPLQR